MATYLMTWNPGEYRWATLREDVAFVKDGHHFEDATWTTGVTKRIKSGDRLFWIRQGEEPKGVFASGWATGPVRPEPHWDKKRAMAGKMSLSVGITYDYLVDPVDDGLVPLKVLRRGVLAKVNWLSASSGISIADVAARKLEELWVDFLRNLKIAGADRDPTLDEPNDNEVSEFEEGEPRRLFVVHRHRERALREAKLASAYGVDKRLRCEVPGCGFDFQAVYGPPGDRFAEVHHRKPLSKTGAVSSTIADLAIVCSNCHRMIHRGGQCRLLTTLVRRGT